MNGRYAGKRFASLLIVVAALMLGFFFGEPEQFGAYSASLAGVYGAFLTGQSATDWKKAKNGT